MNHQTRTAGLPARGKFRFGGASSDNRGEFRPGYSAGRALRGVFAGRDPAPAHEEAGVDPDGVEVLGTLPELFIPPTGFEVVPVLAWWRQPCAVAPVDPGEVAAAGLPC